MAFRVPSRDLFQRPTVEVARWLLGMTLEHAGLRGRINEVEAYLPAGDEAAHAYRGRTPRTEVIFGPPGHAYVYLVYGMYHCLNVITEPEGTPGCVLIRGVEGVGDGPGKLTRALGITRQHNGCDLLAGPIRILDDGHTHGGRIDVTPRIGIRAGADLPLRFLRIDPR